MRADLTLHRREHGQHRRRKDNGGSCGRARGGARGNRRCRVPAANHRRQELRFESRNICSMIPDRVAPFLEFVEHVCLQIDLRPPLLRGQPGKERDASERGPPRSAASLASAQCSWTWPQASGPEKEGPFLVVRSPSRFRVDHAWSRRAGRESDWKRSTAADAPAPDAAEEEEDTDSGGADIDTTGRVKAGEKTNCELKHTKNAHPFPMSDALRAAR